MSLRCQYLPVSLFWSLVLYLAPLNYCIALFTSAHAGIASNHVRSCCSVIPLALVIPPVVFMLRIRNCSIIRSVDKPAHARSLLLATCGPYYKVLVYYRMIIRQVSHVTEIHDGGLCIQRLARSGQLRKHLRHSFKIEIPVAQPFGSEELTENPFRIEVLHPLAVGSFANVSTWRSRMDWILAMASSFATSSASFVMAISSS